MMEQVPTFTELLQLLASPEGAWLAVSFFASWFLEKFDFWKFWDNPTWKRNILIGLAMLLALGVERLGQFPDLLAQIEPIYAWVITFIGSWVTLEFAHRFQKKLAGPEG